MKLLQTIIAITIYSIVGAFADTKWTYQGQQGEDATSTNYFFFESNGDSIQRVRWVWNGGAQNPPTVRDFILESGKITVRHLVGERKDVAALTLGRDADLKLKKEYSLKSKMLIPIPPAESLSDAQRLDLSILIDLLAREREPYRIRAQQGGADQPATVVKPNPDGNAKPKPESEGRPQ